jgi:hypothetical protein
MPNLETTNVFIDTEYFDASNLNFESNRVQEAWSASQGTWNRDAAERAVAGGN